MIYENPMIFKKLVRSESKEKSFHRKILLKVLFLVGFKYFHENIIWISVAALGNNSIVK